MWSNARVTPQPGWYPDPAGSEHSRYWDGSAWTEQLSGDEPRRGRLPRGVLPAGGVLALLIVLGIVAVTLWPGSQPPLSGPVETSSPTISAWDEQPDTAEPTPTPSESHPGRVPCGVEAFSVGTVASGRATGGGLTFPVLTGWRAYSQRFSPVLTDTATVIRSVEGASWVSLLESGLAPGYPSPELAARAVIECHITSSAFPGYIDHRVMVSQAIAIDGADGWWVRIHAHSSESPGGGAVYDAVALDTGDGRIRAYWSGVVDADADAQGDADSVRANLRVAP